MDDMVSLFIPLLQRKMFSVLVGHIYVREVKRRGLWLEPKGLSYVLGVEVGLKSPEGDEVQREFEAPGLGLLNSCVPCKCL